MRILVLTDTSDYGAEATIFPLIRGLCENSEVTGVYIADRSIYANESFYDMTAVNPASLYVRKADKRYAFINQHLYPAGLLHMHEVDAVWLRFDKAEEIFLRYVRALWPDRFISNDPAGMIRTGTKAFLLSLQPRLRGLMPPIALCNNIDNVMSFKEKNPDMVLKVLRSCGGKGVVRFKENGPTDLNSREEAAHFIQENGACLAMQYLDNPHQSDNRLIVLDGEILGAIARVPKPGGWLCNLSAGGSYEIAEPDAREIEMIRRITPSLRALGIHYYGVDTLLTADGKRMLSEINTTNAGGAWRYERVTGKPVCRMIADQFVTSALQTLDVGRLPA